MAASNATRALFARLQQRTAVLKSISLLDCLLAAHAAIVSTSESLGAAMGNAGGPETQQVLQVCMHSDIVRVVIVLPRCWERPVSDCEG